MMHLIKGLIRLMNTLFAGVLEGKPLIIKSVINQREGGWKASQKQYVFFVPFKVFVMGAFYITDGD